MADNNILPKAQSQLVDATGKPTRAFYDFFRALVNRVQGQIDGLTQAIATLAKIVASLGGDPDNLPDISAELDTKVDKTTEVRGRRSIGGGGALDSDVYLWLAGDIDDPPVPSFYGILDGTAGRSWNLISDNFAAVDNGDDTYTLDLADVTLTTGGTLKLRAFDAKGRLSQEDDATTTDLTEGDNLYYTDARVLATDLTGLSVADDSDVAETDSVLIGVGKLQAQATTNATAIGGKEPTIAAGSAAQYWRGDKSWQTLDKADVGLGNVDNTSDVNKPVSTAQQAALDALLPPGYIDGLQMRMASSTSLTVTSGVAYIEDAGTVLRSSAPITKTGLSALTASAWYHVYLFDNAGTPDIEVVTTAPAAAYNGTARSKTGDASRRYIGSVKTNSSGNVINFWQSGTTVSYVVNIGSGAPPFRILSGGTATSLTTVSASGIIPLTATLVQASFIDTSTSGGFLCVSPGNYTGPAGVVVLNHATKMNSLASTDGSQAFVYQYASAPSGGAAYIDVFGYVFER